MDELMHDLAPAYALDALDDDERANFETHLAGCAACQEMVASYHDVGAALAAAAAGPTPREGLRDDIIRAIRSEPRDLPQATGEHVPIAVQGEAPSTAVDVDALMTRVKREQRRRWFRMPKLLGPSLAAAAAAATVAVGLGLHAAGLSNDLDKARDALAVLGSPDAREVQLAAGNGRLVVRGSDAVLVLADLAPAPEGKDYEAWIVEDGTPRPAGVFDGRNALVRISGAVPSGAVVAITIEEDGGSATGAPTTTPVVASDPV